MTAPQRLTDRETEILDIVQRWCEDEDGDVSVGFIVRRAWNDGDGLSHGQTYRTLRKLELKGVLYKPRRGHYAIAEGG